jgi:hypothetical protein
MAATNTVAARHKPVINHPALTLSDEVGGSDTVGKVDKSKAAKVSGILYRYMWTRHCCVGAPASSDPIWLAYLIEWGKTKFDNVYIEPDESPPVVWDNQHPAFFSALLKTDDAAMPRPADLAAWRTYVLYNSLPPKRPEGLAPRTGAWMGNPAALARTDAGPSLGDPIAEVWGKLQITATPRRTASGQRRMRIQPQKLPGSAELPAGWRHIAHFHGNNVLGALMVTVMLYAVVLTLLAS